jgi:hypothetical protein
MLRQPISYGPWVVEKCRICEKPIFSNVLLVDNICSKCSEREEGEVIKEVDCNEQT